MLGKAVELRNSKFLWVQDLSQPDTVFHLPGLGYPVNVLPLCMAATMGWQMLASPKAKRFVQDFLDQWLELRDFDATSPDRKLYPEYTPHLEDAIRREPAEFFQLVLGLNLPVSALVHTGINMVNQRLASRVLEKRGHRVTVASTGREVLDMLSEQGGLNILASNSVDGRVSASLTNVDIAVRRPLVLKPNCGPVLAWRSGLLAAFMCTITPIMSAACCIPWAGVPKNHSAVPSSAMKKRFATGCAIPGVPLKKSPAPERLAGVSR